MSSEQKQFVMKTGIGLTTIVLALAIWWIAATPPPHLAVQPAFEMGPTLDSITQVNAKGDPLSEELLTEFKNLPGHDEIILQEDPFLSLF